MYNGLFILFLLITFITNKFYKDDNPALPDYTVEKVTELTAEVEENSGIIVYNNLVWTFNDGGGDPVLFGLSPENGSLIKKIIIRDGVNIDWEAVAQNNRYIFIGDIGNNHGSRKDLKIYYFDKDSINKDAEQVVSAYTISFVYEDQTDFSRANFSSPYDCEALTANEDSLFLYTKDWANLSTSVYLLPAIEGNYFAKKISVYNTEGLVTGADLKNDTLVLCGYNLFNPFVLIFSDYKTLEYSDRFDLENFSGLQVEGVAFLKSDEILLSNEKSSATQALHLLKIKKSE